MTPNMNLTVTDRNGRKCVSTGSPWEPIVGYSRAVREGDFIFVTGTLGLEHDGRFGPTLKDQTRRALEIIVAAIEALGRQNLRRCQNPDLRDRHLRWREAAEVHSEYFESIRPATTMVQVAKLIDDKAMVEIEADAVVRHKPHDVNCRCRAQQSARAVAKPRILLAQSRRISSGTGRLARK